MSSTSVLIRVQAAGGKFLGPDIGYALVTVRNVTTGAILAQGVATGDSGTLGNFGPGATLETIVTPTMAAPIVQWLSPDATTASYTATFDLEAPALVEISAAAMTNGIPNEHVTSSRVWLWPGLQLTQQPGFVLSLPGLAVQILTPDAATKPSGTSLTVSAWITMMCGCEISNVPPNTPNQPWEWPASEFDVKAMLLNVSGELVAIESLALQQTSVFGGTLANLQPGEYQLVITAHQPSVSNTGLASRWLTLSA